MFYLLYCPSRHLCIVLSHLPPLCIVLSLLSSSWREIKETQPLLSPLERNPSEMWSGVRTHIRNRLHRSVYFSISPSPVKEIPGTCVREWCAEALQGCNHIHGIHRKGFEVETSSPGNLTGKLMCAMAASPPTMPSLTWMRKPVLWILFLWLRQLLWNTG